VILEDLHWADDALLDFVTHVFEWARETPLVLLCTARSELLDRRPGWGANEPRSLTVPLAPLSDRETAELFTSLVPGQAGEELLARASGNPLYTEQYARLVAEGGALDELPATVHGIIAARLDRLSEQDKGLVRDAAVVGRVFWSGAVAALSGDDRWSIEERLLSLERRELVRRERHSSVDGETEYAFRHVLLRDVAYGQIPRAARSTKHSFAAAWIEDLGRPEYHAEFLAHHYLAALEYTSLIGQDTSALVERARVALKEAADGALSLNAFSAAARLYERALELWPTDDAERPLLLLSYGRALYQFRLDDDPLVEARDRFLLAGDVQHAAEAEALLGQFARMTARLDEARAHFDRALELIDGQPPSPAVAYVLAMLTRSTMTGGESERAVELAGRTLAMAEALGLEEIEAVALIGRGPARIQLGDPAGVGDLERAVEITERIRSAEAYRAYGNLGVLLELGQVRRSYEFVDKAIEVAEEYGAEFGARFHRGNRIVGLYLVGRWDTAWEECDRFLAEVERGKPHYMEGAVRTIRALIQAARGQPEAAVAEVRAALRTSRKVGEPQALHPALLEGARVLVDAGQPEEARALLDEMEDTDVSGSMLPRFAVLVDALGVLERARSAVVAARLSTPWVAAATAYVEGDLVGCADLLSEIGAVVDEADVRMRAGERLSDEGRRADAHEQLERALTFWRSVGATTYIARCEALLAEAG
jgi:tetratricopeptide (TPR) repeat protein